MTKNKLNQLIIKAKEARKNAYAPYSGFKVGAAILTESGKIFSGSNVENASFGLTICAERAAICHAINQGEKHISVVVIVTDSAKLTPPCGACRQFIQEFGPQAEIILVNLKGQQANYNQSVLLPQAFNPEDINPR